MHDLPIYTQLCIYAVALWVIERVFERLLFLASLWRMNDKERAHYFRRGAWADAVAKALGKCDKKAGESNSEK